MKIFFYGVLLLLGAGLQASAAEPAFSLRGNRIQFQSDGLPMTEFLRKFHEAGVRVLMDPSLAEEFVAGRVADAEVGAALDVLFDRFDYALFWARIPGPAEPLDRPSELWVFRRGKSNSIRPLFGPRNLEIAGDSTVRYVRGEILIGFNPGVTRERVNELLRGIGGEIVGGIPGLGVYRVRLPESANIPEIVAAMERDPLVAAVEPDFAYALPGAASAATGAPIRALPPSAIGSGDALLAVLDSGIRADGSLSSLISGSFNALDPKSSPNDTAGHGTQMAMIASGLVSPSGVEQENSGFRKILAIKGFDDNGMTSSWAIMEALRVATEQGVRVMNLSWGSETQSAFLKAALYKASQDGLLLVAAAGNEATGRPVYPAAYPGVLAVAATDPNGQPSAYSNFGAFVDLSAPATAELSVGYEGPPGTYAGTSIASAFTAGILAEYLSRNPDSTPAQAISKLNKSLSSTSSYGKNHGSGVLDSAAVKRFLGP